MVYRESNPDLPTHSPARYMYATATGYFIIGIEITSRYTALAIQIENVIGNMPRSSFIFQKQSLNLLSLSNSKEYILVYSDSNYKN